MVVISGWELQHRKSGFFLRTSGILQEKRSEPQIKRKTSVRHCVQNKMGLPEGGGGGEKVTTPLRNACVVVYA